MSHRCSKVMNMNESRPTHTATHPRTSQPALPILPGAPERRSWLQTIKHTMIHRVGNAYLRTQPSGKRLTRQYGSAYFKAKYTTLGKANICRLNISARSAAHFCGGSG